MHGAFGSSRISSSVPCHAQQVHVLHEPKADVVAEDRRHQCNPSSAFPASVAVSVLVPHTRASFFSGSASRPSRRAAGKTPETLDRSLVNRTPTFAPSSIMKTVDGLFFSVISFLSCSSVNRPRAKLSRSPLSSTLTTLLCQMLGSHFSQGAGSRDPCPQILKCTAEILGNALCTSAGKTAAVAASPDLLGSLGNLLEHPDGQGREESDPASSSSIYVCSSIDVWSPILYVDPCLFYFVCLLCIDISIHNEYEAAPFEHPKMVPISCPPTPAFLLYYDGMRPTLLSCPPPLPPLMFWGRSRRQRASQFDDSTPYPRQHVSFFKACPRSRTKKQNAVEDTPVSPHGCSAVEPHQTETNSKS